MPLLTLYINTAANQLLTSLSSAAVLNSVTTPLFAGDSGLTVQVYLLTPLQVQNPSQYNFSIIPTTGSALEMFLTNGLFGADCVIYTQQIVWQTDPNNQYFYATLALNTAGVEGLFTTNTSANATLQVGYLAGGLQVSNLYLGVTLLPGIPNALAVVPAGLTPLSQQAADQRYVPIVPKAGAAIELMSPNGKIIALIAVDNPDGMASFQANAIN